LNFEGSLDTTTEIERIRALFNTTRKNFLVLGSAGTGKSVLLRNLVRNSSKKVIVAAFTGLAALHAGGKTIHSLFGFGLGLQRRRHLRNRSENFDESHPIFCDLEVLLIDEVSMLRADLLDAIDCYLRDRGPRKNEPFGGIQIGLFGDALQLPPIVKDGQMPAFNGQWAAGWPSPWFFDALSFRTGNFQRVTLNKIFRQDEGEKNFIRSLQRLREARTQQEDISLLNSRVRPEMPHNGVALVTTNQIAQKINQHYFDQLQGLSKVSLAKSENWPRDWSKSDLPAPETLELKVGARVIVCANAGNGLVNGSVGTISKIRDDEVILRIDDASISLQRYTWEFPIWKWDREKQEMVESGKAKYTQLPLKLAWAMTIHKAQGQTIDGAVWVDLGRRVWSGGQTYVALSRVRRLEQLHLCRPIRENDVLIDGNVLSFLASGDTPVSLEEIRAKAGEIYRKTEQVKEAAEIQTMIAREERQKAETARNDAEKLFRATEKCQMELMAHLREINLI
jgi:ATP-dependent DNA helicase PIF1